MTIKPITISDVNDEIAVETYFTAAEGRCGAIARGRFGSNGDSEAPMLEREHIDALDAVTICVLVLRNGTKVVGFNYGHIDPAKHSREQGRAMARSQAIDKAWELMTHSLRDSMLAESLKRTTEVLAPQIADAGQALSESQALKDLLDLVGLYEVSIPTISTWTSEERTQAEGWAYAAHLKASDNSIDVPPVPACVLACPRMTFGDGLGIG